MKKFIISVLLLFCSLFITACSIYTNSLVFYEIQEGGPFDYPVGEIAVVENKDNAITELIVPDSYNGKPVTLIGSCAFLGCKYLTKVTLPESIKYIEVGAFSYCDSLTNITLPESLLFIGWKAFECDRELKSITIGSSLFRIADEAFKDCDSLQDIYYNGTQEDWNKIEIWEGNECLLNATIHYNG